MLVTVPGPLIDMALALATDHDRLAVWPEVIDEGLAVKEEMVGADC